MKTFLPILLLGPLVASAKTSWPNDELPSPSEGKTWKVVWHDEFGGDKLDEVAVMEFRT